MLSTTGLTDEQIANRNIDYVFRVSDLRAAAMHLIRTAYEVEVLLRRYGETANADWFRRHIENAENAASELQELMK